MHGRRALNKQLLPFFEDIDKVEKRIRAARATELKVPMENGLNNNNQNHNDGPQQNNVDRKSVV